MPRLVHFSKSPAYLVMQKVGPTLLALNRERRGMTPKTIIMLGLKALDGLEEIHSAGFLHRDIKPDNISVALVPTESTIFFIDFGLSSRYERFGSHVAYAEGQEFTGTPYFASLNSVKGVRPSRRDDLESLGYILLYLLQGNLPWFTIQSPKRTETLLCEVLKSREKHPLAVLCQSHWEMKEFLAYCQGLAYAEKPNYDYLRRLLTSWALQLALEIDWVYDWTPAHIPRTLSPLRKHHLKREKKRKTVVFANSPSLNMAELQEQSEDSSPGRMRDSLRRFSIETSDLESPSTGENSPEMAKTPVRSIDQIPSLACRPLGIRPIRVQMEPKTALLPTIEEVDAKTLARRSRSHTCDEIALFAGR